MQRNRKIDFIKGIAIFLVIVGHSIQYGSGDQYICQQSYFLNIVFKIIYSFHMPLFMLISGYLLHFTVEKYSLYENIKKKITGLIIPIVGWSVVSLIIEITIKKTPVEDILSVYKGLLLFNLWFLWAIFFCSLAVIIVNKFFNDHIAVYLLGFILTFVIPDSYNLALYKYMYPFFLAGYFFAKKGFSFIKKEYFARYGMIVVVATSIMYILLIRIYDTSSYIYNSQYTLLGRSIPRQLMIDLYRMSIGFVGSILIILIIHYSFNYIPEVIKKVVINMGKNSLGLYILSDYIFRYLLRYFTYNIPKLDYTLTFLEVLIITILSLALSKLIQKNRIINTIAFGGRRY